MRLSKDLIDGLAELQAAARHIADTSLECKLQIDAEEYVGGFKPTFMTVVYEWSKGASFGAVCELVPDIYEGSVIR